MRRIVVEADKITYSKSVELYKESTRFVELIEFHRSCTDKTVMCVCNQVDLKRYCERNRLDLSKAQLYILVEQTIALQLTPFPTIVFISRQLLFRHV